jgi:lipopolysaccharide exporter
VTQPGSDPSRPIGAEPAVDMESPGNALPPTDPPEDPSGTASAECASVVLPPPSPDSWRTAVVVPPPAFGDDRQADRAPSPFSVRKVVLTTSSADPAPEGGNEVAAGGSGAAGAGSEVAQEPALSNPQTTPPNPPGVVAGADTRPESLDGGASARERRAAISNGLRWTMIGRPIIEAANLLGVAVLARLVAPAEFGRYTIALIVLLLAGVPAQAVQYPIVQRDQINRDHLKTGVTLTIVMGLAMCALCLAASYTVVSILFGAQTSVLVRLMIPALFINSVNTVQLAIITRRLEFRRLSLLDMTITLVGAAVAIPLAAMGLQGEAMVFGVLAGSTAGFILICFWVLPPVPNFRLGAARELLRSGTSAASNMASLVGFQNCDYVIVGARLGALQAGYYFRAYTLGVTYQTKVSQVLTTLGFPVLSRVETEDEVHRLRRRMVHTMTLIIFPLLAALAIVAPKFVPWFYGPQWSAVIVPVQILTIGGAAMLISQAVTVSMLATGRARAVSLWGWGHFLVYGGAVFAVARLGLPAVALAAVVVHLTFLVISYLLLVRGGVSQAFKTLAKDTLPAAASCVGLVAVALPVSLLASALDIPVLLYLFMIAIAGSAGYFICLRLWFPNELRHLGGIAGRLLPARLYRLFSRFITRLPARSASRWLSIVRRPLQRRHPMEGEASAHTSGRRGLAPWGRQPAGRRVGLGAVASSRANNFDALRLFGALLVLVSHSFALSGRPEPTFGGVTLGTVGVFIFFGISGFLITKSWVREPRPGPFFAKRALRILPALVVVSVLSAYLIGPLVTTASLGHYFGDPLTHAYALRNATLRTDYLLPAVFAHNPYPHAVNGSLWTLPIEARAYVAVAIIGLLVMFFGRGRPRAAGLKRHPRLIVVVCSFFVALGLALATLKALGVSHKLAAYGLGPPTVHDVTGGVSDQWYLFLTFGAGAALYVWRDRVTLRWDAFVAAIAIWVLAPHATVLPLSIRTMLVPALVLPYATLVVAFRGSALIRKPTAWGDISYGVYIWAFPIAQIVALKVAHASPGMVIAISLPATCLLAAASWLVIERHALRLKPGARTRSRPIAPSPVPAAPTPTDHLHPRPEPALPAVTS